MPNNLSNLDANQVIRTVYSDADEALKTIPSSNTSFNIELDAADGDSVISHTNNITSSATGLDNSNTGVVLAEFDISGIKNINIYSKTTSTIVGAQVLTLEISPTDTGDIWVATSLTITPSLTLNTVIAGTTLINVAARRARISTAAAITSGTYDLYAVGQS